MTDLPLNIFPFFAAEEISDTIVRKQGIIIIYIEDKKGLKYGLRFGEELKLQKLFWKKDFVY